MGSSEISEKRQSIIKATWEYLLRKGLSNASVGELCRETKLAQSSLYYWFENKDDIWINAGKYGLTKVVEALFTYTLIHTDDLQKYFSTLLREADKYKYELRCVIQITVSPIYGERMRKEMKELNGAYDEYAKKLIGIFGCTVEQAEVFIYSIISAIIDYVVWDDGEKTQILIDNLMKRVKRALG